MRHPAAVLICLLAGSLFTGCVEPCPETFVPMEQLVQEQNENAAKVDRLWARVNFIATVKQDGLTYPYHSPLLPSNGYLLLEKGLDPLGPHNFVLIVRETGVNVFRAGSNVEEGVYYAWANLGERSEARVGRLKYAGAGSVAGLALDPLQLLYALGILSLPADQSTLPAVSMKLQRQPGDCAYVVNWIDREPDTGRILIRREMLFRWSDDKPRQLYRMNIYDNQGRKLMTVDADDYEPVAAPGAPEDAELPVMPTDIRVKWHDWPGLPGGIESIRLLLSEMTLEERGDPASASRFKANLPAGIPVRVIDANLDQGGSSR